MATHLYCLVVPARAERGRGPVPEGLVGIAGAAVRVLTAGAGADAVDAWVSTVSEAEAALGGEALVAAALAHNEVVTAALAMGTTPLPARYGQRFPSDDACRADLTLRAPALRGALGRVAGMVEMAILVATPEPSVVRTREPAPSGVPSARTGRAYLEMVRAREHAAAEASTAREATLARIADSVRDLVRHEAPGHSSGSVTSREHLVPREHAVAYRERAEAAARDLSAGVRVLIAGPRAPYSFGAIERGDGGA